VAQQMDVEAVEQRIEALQRDQAATRATLETVEADLVQAARARELAQAVYDEAARQYVLAANAHGGANHAPGEAWSPRSDAEAVRVRMAAETATRALEQARAELDPVRRRHNALDRRRGELRAHMRFLEGQIEKAQAELARQHTAAHGRRGLLDEIRARVLERG
jgi:chromosome segregation ATPase